MSLNDGIETNQNKKNPILKFWWVWLIIILVAIGILVPNLIIRNAMSTNSVTQTGKNKIVKVGDTITQDGVYYKINSVTIILVPNILNLMMEISMLSLISQSKIKAKTP